VSGLKGHPGTTRIIQADLPAGVFTRVTAEISIYQDSGYPVRAVVQLTNSCNYMRRADHPGCCLPIDHPGDFHANVLGEAWAVSREQRAPIDVPGGIDVTRGRWASER
jgi:hypothetical protein